MRVIRTLGSVLSFLITALLAVVLICNLYTIGARFITDNPQPTVFGWSWAVVISGSMEPEIHVNDLVVVHAENEYAIGDVIAFHSGRSVVTHRIVGETPEGYSTQGDANNTIDSAPVPKENIIGKVMYVAPMVGLYIEYLRTPLGMTCMVMIGILLIQIPYLIEKGRVEKGGRS